VACFAHPATKLIKRDRIEKVGRAIARPGADKSLEAPPPPTAGRPKISEDDVLAKLLEMNLSRAGSADLLNADDDKERRCDSLDQKGFVTLERCRELEIRKSCL